MVGIVLGKNRGGLDSYDVYHICDKLTAIIDSPPPRRPPSHLAWLGGFIPVGVDDRFRTATEFVTKCQPGASAARSFLEPNDPWEVQRQ